MAFSSSQRSHTRPQDYADCREWQRGSSFPGVVSPCLHNPFSICRFHLLPAENVRLVAVVFQTCCEAYVCRAVNQDVITAGADAVQCTDNSAQNAIFVANVSGLQTGDTVACFLPADDGLIIFRRGFEVTEGRVTGPFDDCLLYGRYSREVHVCYPHRDGIEASFGGAGEKPSPFRPSTAMESLPCRSMMEVKSYFIWMLLLKNSICFTLSYFWGRGNSFPFQYDVPNSSGPSGIC